MATRDYLSIADVLIEGLAMIHPFIDGSKRVAFAAADVYLRINGWRMNRPSGSIYAEMMKMFDTGQFDLAHRAPWIRQFATRVK